MLCIEIDEGQHKRYDSHDEEERYDNLFMDFSGKYIFLRFNPDSYKVGRVKRNPKLKERLFTLKYWVKLMIRRIQDEKNLELVEIYHLYYDEMRL